MQIFLSDRSGDPMWSALARWASLTAQNARCSWLVERLTSFLLLTTVQSIIP